MRRTHLLSLFGAAAVILVFAGCQTAKPVNAEQSMIKANAPGFAPASQSGSTAMGFALSFGNSSLVKSWTVQVIGAAGTVKTFSGDGKSLPATLSWDGKNDSGSLVPGGTFTASLAVDFGGKLPKGSAVTDAFVADMTPPTSVLTVSPAQITPSAQGLASPITLTVEATSLEAKVSGWTIKIFDSNGTLFQTFDGTWPDHTVTWDGKGTAGQYVQPSMTYSAEATVKDSYGLASVAKASVLVAAAAAQEQMPQASVPTGQDAIQASLNGFSPKSQTGPKDIQLYLTFGNPSGVHSWTVTLASSDQGKQKVFTGVAGSLPSSLAWNGENDSGAMSPDGTYTAALSVDYGNGTPTSAESTPFILDVTPPTGSVALSETLFSPEETSKTIGLTVDASSPVAKIESWTMKIISPEGVVFRTFTGTWPQNQATWDGTSSTGAFVESAEDYPFQVNVTDAFGNVGTLKGKVPVDILVFDTPEGYRIQASRIFFKPFTADYMDVAPEIAHQNIARLDSLAAKLKKFPGDKIRVVGHAVMIYWNNPTLGKLEQQDVLIPLSMARAKAIEQALSDRGVHPKEFVADGVGASDQIVPDSDLKDRWQNRRVALFIEK